MDRKTLQHHVTLHEEIAAILTENRNDWMTPQEIVEAVNRRCRYRRHDGTSLVDWPMTANQIRARVGKPRFAGKFERADGKIRLSPKPES